MKSLDDGSPLGMWLVTGTELLVTPVAYPGIFSAGWGVQQIQLRTEDRANGDLEA